jgi:hypothetical protein
MTYDNTEYSDTMPPGYGLRDLVAFLMDLANDGVLNKEGEQQLTEEELRKLYRHGRLLSGAVEFLVNGLSPDALGQLWQALGSAAVIASYAARNPMDERQKLERAACATEGRKTQSQEIDDIIVTVASPIWRRNPALSSWHVTNQIIDTLNKQLKKPLGREAIHKRLVRLKPRILSKGSAHVENEKPKDDRT